MKDICWKQSQCSVQIEAWWARSFPGGGRMKSHVEVLHQPLSVSLLGADQRPWPSSALLTGALFLHRMRVCARWVLLSHWLLLAYVLMVCCKLTSASSQHLRGHAGKPFKLIIYCWDQLIKCLTHQSPRVRQVLDKSFGWYVNNGRATDRQGLMARAGAGLCWTSLQGII